MPKGFTVPFLIIAIFGSTVLMIWLGEHLIDSFEALIPIFTASPFALLCILAMVIAWKDITVARAALILGILLGSAVLATLVTGTIGGTDDPEMYGGFTNSGLILRKTLAGAAGGLAAGLSLQLLSLVPALIASKASKIMLLVVSFVSWTFMGFVGGYVWVRNMSFGLNPMIRFVVGFALSEVLMFANSNNLFHPDVPEAKSPP